MDFTNKILSILKEELEPYQRNGEVYIDGVLTAASIINDLIVKTLNESLQINN